jgi:uncharacterized phosphosugar-binding protein
MSANAFLDTALDRLQLIRDEQEAALRRAAEICAGTIGKGGLVHLFGTGHGSIPVLEAFPRSGAVVGFRPVVETPVSFLFHVWGDMGVPQFRFLQSQEGYGRAILEAHRPADGDAVIVFSHSGSNPVVLDFALAARERGHALVGVTSLEHSRQVKSRHSSGRRLFEVANVVIDTGAPFGDASVRIQGLDEPVGAVSTVLVVAVVQAIVAETAAILAADGKPVHVEVNPQVPREGSPREHNMDGYRELWKRLTAR